jgi:DNA-binding response OmpR family regulator
MNGKSAWSNVAFPFFSVATSCRFLTVFEEPLLTETIMHARLLEIHHKIEICLQEVFTLRSEEAAILEMIQQQNRETAFELSFDERGRTIRWTGGMLKLSRKQFSLIKTIWNNGKRTETLDEIELAIWHDAGTDEKPFIGKNTLFALISRLRNSVSAINFPYEIESVKDGFTGELQGYRLTLKEF